MTARGGGRISSGARVRRAVDGDRLRELARYTRDPRGLDESEQEPRRYLFLATVSATATGPNRVTLDRHGVSIPNVRYLASYSPTVSDVVLCEYVGDDVIVWGEFA